MKTVKSGRLRASYSLGSRPRGGGVSIPLPTYVQEDYHSCGFLAALTVARYFYPRVPDVDVLRAVRPGMGTGTPSERVVAGLAKVGVEATYRGDLCLCNLRGLVMMNIPTIISVWPSEWPGDHWTVVRGFRSGRIYLTNHYSLTLDWFWTEWVTNWGDGACTGAGLVCKKVGG